MKPYTIIISPKAEQDIEAAYLYIKSDSPQNAMSWYRTIYNKIQSLSSFPLRYPPAPENDFFQQEIRHLIFHNYRIIYTTTKETVYILHCRHVRQEWLMPK